MNEKPIVERIQNKKKILMEKKRGCEKRLHGDFRRNELVIMKKNTWNNKNMHNSKQIYIIIR